MWYLCYVMAEIKRDFLGSLSSKHGHTGNSVVYGTADGSIGTITCITKEQYDLLKALQDNLEALVPSIGRLSHNQ